MTPLLTARDVAHLLAVHPNHVYTLAKRGDLPVVRVGETRLRFVRSDVEAYILRNRQPAD